MSCFLCLSPLASGVLRILECPDHWVHEHCYIPPMNPEAIRCQVCLKQGTTFVNGFMYQQNPSPEEEEQEQEVMSDIIPEVKLVQEEEELTVDPHSDSPGPALEGAVKVDTDDALSTFAPLESCIPMIPSIPKFSVTHGATSIIEHWDQEADAHYFSCAKCEKTYAGKYKLKLHIQKYHTGNHDHHDHLPTKQTPRPRQPLHGKALAGVHDVDAPPESSSHDSIKKEESDVLDDDSAKDKNDSLKTDLCRFGSMLVSVPTSEPLSTEEEPRKRVNTWTKAGDLFKVKREGHAKSLYKKICLLCSPPKTVGFIENRELYKQHVIKHHMGENGVIQCPYCPRTTSSIIQIAGLVSHISFSHSAHVATCEDSEECTDDVSSTKIQLNSKILASATLNEAREKMENISDPPPDQHHVIKRTPRWRNGIDRRRRDSPMNKLYRSRVINKVEGRNPYNVRLTAQVSFGLHPGVSEF